MKKGTWRKKKEERREKTEENVCFTEFVGLDVAHTGGRSSPFF